MAIRANTVILRSGQRPFGSEIAGNWAQAGNRPVGGEISDEESNDL